MPPELPSGDRGPIDRPANAAIGWIKKSISDALDLMGGDHPTKAVKDIQWALQPSNKRQQAGANASVVAGVLLLPWMVWDMAKSALGLRKQLASESQLAEIAHGGGVAIIGPGTGRELKVAERLAERYGGSASDWVKVASSSHKASDGATFQIHAYKNMSTGNVVEIKTVIDKQGSR